MAELIEQLYSFDEDGILRLQKDLNYMFQHLDHKNVRRLYTEYCEISSEEGETTIDGPLIIMTDNSSTTIRLKMGWDEASSNFVFNLYNIDGDPTIELDSTGDAVFSGSIQTGVDAYIGEHLYVGSSKVPLNSVTSNTRGVFIMKPGTTEYLAQIYSTNPMGVSTDWDFEIESSVGFNLTGLQTGRLYMYAGYDAVSTASINTTDYLEIYAWNGRTLINADHSHTTDRGLMLGNDNRDVFLGSYSLGGKTRLRGTLDFESRWENDMDYFYSRNQKFIGRPSSDWIVTSTNAAKFGSTRVITSTRNTFVHGTSTSAGYVELQSTFTSLDLSVFVDGSAVTSDDYFVSLFWINSTSFIDSTLGVSWQFGNSSSINQRFRMASGLGDTFNNGWNIFYTKVGNIALTEGAPSWNNVNWCRAGARTLANSSGYGMYIDYMGFHRADPDDGSYFNDFQKEINSTWARAWNSLPSFYEGLAFHHAGKPCVVPLNIEYTDQYALSKRSYSDFEAEMKVHTHAGNEVPAITWYVASNLNCYAQVSSGVMRLGATQNGTTYGDFINCNAFGAFTDCTLKLCKNSTGILEAYFKTDTDPASVRMIRLDSPVMNTSNPYGALWIGSNSYDKGMLVKSMTIRPYTE